MDTYSLWRLIRLLYYLLMERMKLTKKEKEQILKNWAEAMSKIIERMSIEMWELEEENKNLREKIKYIRKLNTYDYNELQDLVITLEEENKNLKERIDVLYEFIERNDKLVDEVIAEEDLDKLNRYIYIDDDLVDRTLESED